MTIYVTRHGESLTNADHHKTSRFPLNSDNNILTLTGVQQAINFGVQLLRDRIDIDRIIASPFSRTKQTAFLIASTLSTCVPIEFDERLREITWEQADGTFTDLGDNIDYLYDHVDTRPHNDSESQADVFNRTIPAFFELEAKYKDENILFVTHYFVCRSILSYQETGTNVLMPKFDPKNLEFIKIDKINDCW